MRRPQRSARPGRAGGFSLLELLFTLAALSIVTGAVGFFQLRTQEQSKSWLARGKIETAARRAIDRVAGELMGVSQTLLDPDPIGALGASTLTYCRPTGVSNAGVITWGNFSRLELELDPAEFNDGDDDDGDGLIDERRLVLVRDVGTPDEIGVVLCSGVGEFLTGELSDGVNDDNGNSLVDEAGFCVQRTGDLLIVRLTVQAGIGEGRIVETMVETRVVLRN